MIRAVLFDLDNTLYDMRHYLLGAYQCVAAAIAKTHRLDRVYALSELMQLGEEMGLNHDRLFNHWFEKLGIDPAIGLPLAVESFHSFTPQTLELYPDVDNTLLYLKENGLHVGILTDGRPSTQKNKIKLLNLGIRVPAVVYSKELGTSKPDPVTFQTLLTRVGVTAQEAVYVGDHPEYDIQGAKNAGLIAIRIRRGVYREMPDISNFSPDFTIEHLNELVNLLITKEL